MMVTRGRVLPGKAVLLVRRRLSQISCGGDAEIENSGQPLFWDGCDIPDLIFLCKSLFSQSCRRSPHVRSAPRFNGKL